MVIVAHHYGKLRHRYRVMCYCCSTGLGVLAVVRRYGHDHDVRFDGVSVMVGFGGYTDTCTYCMQHSPISETLRLIGPWCELGRFFVQLCHFGRRHGMKNRMAVN